MNTTENPPTPPLDSREAMLETLHMAYQFVLDQYRSPLGPRPARLSDEDGRELGLRLAQYWDMKADYEDAVAVALAMTAESDARMNAYTSAQRAALEKEARDFAAYYEERFKTEQ